MFLTNEIQLKDCPKSNTGSRRISAYEIIINEPAKLIIQKPWGRVDSPCLYE